MHSVGYNKYIYHIARTYNDTYPHADYIAIVCHVWIYEKR